MMLNRRILRLAVPAIFNNITVPLLGLCDTAIAGHLGDASYLAAMAVGAMMLNVIFWLCGFLRMGTTGLTAQALGAGQNAETGAILRRAFLIAITISIAVLALQRPLESLLFIIIAPDGAVTGLSATYFRIVVWSVPAQLVIMVVSGWFIGLQNTVVPMLIAVGVNVVNIMLSIMLVFLFDCGFAGIAYGTLAANWVGAAAAAGAALWRRRTMAKEGAVGSLPHATQGRAKSIEKGPKPKSSSLFRINVDLFFRSACIMGVTLAMTAYGSRIGETALAANAVIMQFFLFFSYFMDGFAFAGEAIAGRAFGASDFVTLRRCVNALLRWGAAMAAIFFIVYAAGTNTIAGWLTDSPSVRAEVDSLYLWIILLPPITVAAFLFDGIFIGVTRTRTLLWTTLLAAAIFFLLTNLPFLNSKFSIPNSPFQNPNSTFYILHSTLKNTSLWLAFEAYLLARGLLLSIVYFVNFARNH